MGKVPEVSSDSLDLLSSRHVLSFAHSHTSFICGCHQAIVERALGCNHITSVHPSVLLFLLRFELTLFPTQLSMPPRVLLL